MILLFHVDNFLLFSTSKDKTEDVYASIKADFNIEDYGYLKKKGIEMYHCPYGSIHLIKLYLTQRKINVIPDMKKSSAKPTPAVNHPLTKK